MDNKGKGTIKDEKIKIAQQWVTLLQERTGKPVMCWVSSSVQSYSICAVYTPFSLLHGFMFLKNLHVKISLFVMRSTTQPVEQLCQIRENDPNDIIGMSSGLSLLVLRDTFII